MKDEQKMFQWHPAFYAGIQIELEQEKDQLEFQNEYQLGTKPKVIDVLIINKNAERPLRKNIARIFKKRNIIEYKGPTDYLSIDDFYTVYGYACFYKADAQLVDAIRIDEITLTFISSTYPRKLIRHLKKERNYEVVKREEGIFYVIGDKIPIQLIVTSRLDSHENIWLRSLTNDLTEKAQADELITRYKKKKDNKLYQSVMNIIVRANKKQFMEVKPMCEALMEIMKDELDEREQRGEQQFARLTEKLVDENRLEDLKRATKDEAFCHQLYVELGIWESK